MNFELMQKVVNNFMFGHQALNNFLDAVIATLVLNAHHSIESQMLFPVLHERGNDGIKKVVQRLMAEHEIVHHFLHELEIHSLSNLQNPTAAGFTEVKETFLALEKIIHSHFKYEETELEMAIGFYGIEF